jgi:hypothetical protein
MQNIQSQAHRPNFVRVMFEDGMSAFELPSDAMFAELAGGLGHLTKRHPGRPIAVMVKIGSWSI